MFRYRVPVIRLRSFAFSAVSWYPDQVTAIIQIFAVDAVVFDQMPAARLDLSNAAAIFGWHQLLSHAGKRHTATTQRIQRAVRLERLVGDLVICERWDIAVYLCIRLARVWRDFPLR